MESEREKGTENEWETEENTKERRNKIRFGKFKIYAKEFWFFFFSSSQYGVLPKVPSVGSRQEHQESLREMLSAIANEKISNFFFGFSWMC